MQHSNEYNAGDLMLESASSNDLQTIENAITNFKQYIKRNLVDLNLSLSYVNFLIETYDTRELSILSFGTLCHLIKRISIQDHTVLTQIYNPIIPFLLNRLKDNKDSIRLTALKSLRTCLRSSPKNIDLIIHYLITDGLFNNDLQIQISTLDIIYEIIEPSSKFIFSFKPLLSSLVKLLKSSNFTISSKSNDLIKLYFTEVNPNNNTAKSDLLNDLITFNISTNIITNLLKSIDLSLYKKYYNIINHESQELIDPSFIQNKLNYILDQTPNWNIDDSSLISIEIDDVLTFESLLNEFEISFDGKETEKNWKNRQLLIIKLRQILRGKSFLLHIDIFINFLKGIKDSIPKGMMSLRTTLSNNSCQLCKELAIYAGSLLDFTIIEPLLLILLKLTSARKIMQHQNANVAIIALLLYTNLNPKVFIILNQTIQEKNIQPRVYIGNWIELICLKYYDPNNSDNNQFLFESIDNILFRGLSDPIPQVKEAMRKAFWTLCEFEPSYEDKIMKRLDYGTVKALERSKSVFINSNDNILKSNFRSSNSKDSFKSIQVKESTPPFIIKQREKENIQVPFESARKSNRSESLDENKLLQKNMNKQPLQQLNQQPQQQQQQQSQSHQSQQRQTLRHHTTPIITKEIEMINNEDSIDDFTGRIKRENIIYEEITSESKIIQDEGFKKLLNENDSSLTIKFHGALNNLTIINSEVFEIIFLTGNENYFSKISTYISTENILRLFCLYLIKSEDYKRIDFIINNLSLEDLCLSIINILNFATDASKVDNINLSFQYIKNKFNIINSILKIFNRLIILKKDIIKSYLLSSIFECLITSFGIINDDLTKEKLVVTFCLCLQEYNDLFRRSIKEINNSILRNDICNALNIIEDGDEDINLNDVVDVSKFSPIKINKDEFDENIDEMTKVVPKIRKHNDEDDYMDGGNDDGDHDVKSENGEFNDIANNNSESKIVNDFTMIFPKRKTNDLFEYENVKLKLDGEKSVGVDELISEIENEENDDESKNELEQINSNTNDIDSNTNHIDSDINDINLDTNNIHLETKYDKVLEDEVEVEVEDEVEDDEDDEDEKENENNISIITHEKDADDVLSIEKTFGEDISMIGKEPPIQEDNDYSMLEKDKSILSDSTPDINQLTIDEGKDIGGYLSLIINELIEYKEVDNIEGENKFIWILQNTDSLDHDKIFNEMIEQMNSEYKIEVLAVIRFFYEIWPDKINGSIISKLNEIIEDSTDELFLCIFEIVELLNIKILVGINKIHQFKLRMQEVILKSILDKMRNNQVDCEDIFMIERIINRGCDNEDSFIRMNSYLIYKEMYRMFIEKICDSKGIELVDEVIVDSMKDEIKRFCGHDMKYDNLI